MRSATCTSPSATTAQSRYDYLFNRLRLKQAAGTLSEADLVSVGAALQ